MQNHVEKTRISEDLSEKVSSSRKHQSQGTHTVIPFVNSLDRNEIVVPMMSYPANFPGVPLQYPSNFYKSNNIHHCPPMWSVPTLYSGKNNAVFQPPLNLKSNGTSRTVKQAPLSQRSDVSQNGDKDHEVQNKEDFKDVNENVTKSPHLEKPKRPYLLPTPKTNYMHPTPHHVLTPASGCYIHVPLMYGKPGMRPQIYQQTNHKINHQNSPSDLKQETHSDHPVAFRINPLFEGLSNSPATKPDQDATSLKTEIVKNVEKLFEMTRGKSSSADLTGSKQECKSFDTDGELLDTIMKCCLEVETYWTENAKECNARALILGCCKSIRRLMNNGIRQNSEDNIVSSLQELTMSLILLFLISSMS